MELPLKYQSLIIIKGNYMARIKNIHPGEIVKEEIFEPVEISAYKLSKETILPQTRICEILKGNRRITTDTAL